MSAAELNASVWKIIYINVTSNNEVIDKSGCPLPDIKSKPETMLILCCDGLMLDVSEGTNKPPQIKSCTKKEGSCWHMNKHTVHVCVT